MYKQHIAQQFTNKRSPFNLKTVLKKLIFDGDKPQVICEDPATFTGIQTINQKLCSQVLSFFFFFFWQWSPGYTQRLMALFTHKSSPVNLKTGLKKLIFDGDKPQVICEDPATFTMVMSTFTQYEKYVSGVKIFMPSFVPSPCPAFHRFQYSKVGEGLVSFLTWVTSG